MSVRSSNLFNYSRPLPKAFDTLKNKKVKVASKYSKGTEATLCGAVIKAVHAYCNCLNGTGEGAVGWIDGQKCVAEYKSSMGPDAYHLVVFDTGTGTPLASVYDKNTETMELYSVHTSKLDGAALFFAIMPQLSLDEEFSDNLKAYREQMESGYPDMDGATDAMGMLCDNVYRRITDDSCPAFINTNIDRSGNIMRISQTQLDSGAFTPTTVAAGEFTIFASTGPAQIHCAAEVVSHSDFIGKYQLNPGRTLSVTEQMLVPKVEDWYIIPKEVVDICLHAKKTTGLHMQMRNFLLRGHAGTGKTMGAKAIAAGLGLPYVKYTCSAGTEIYDFIGMVFPNTEEGSTGNKQLDQERAQLKAMGGVTYANVAKVMNLPDLDDMDYDPAGVYQALTGVEKSMATTQDCIGVVLDLVTEKVKALSTKPEQEKTTG